MVRVLNLLYYGHPLLRKKALKIDHITEDVRNLALAMIELMDEKGGVGLAAPQVGSSLRLFVIRPEVEVAGETLLGEPEVFINPILSSPSKEKLLLSEGCLSIPGVHVPLERPVSVHVQASNLEGKEVSFTATGFKAREIMHENDHLNGMFFVDRLPKDVYNSILPRLKEIKKGGAL